MEEKKRFRLEIEGIQRNDEVLTIKEISNKLKQKWVQQAMKNTDKLCIEIFDTKFVDKFTQRSGWSVNYEKEHPVVKLTDCTGADQVFDFNKIIVDNFISEFETIMESSKLLFLTGNNKDYECAWNDLINKINYKKRIAVYNRINDKGER